MNKLIIAAAVLMSGCSQLGTTVNELRDDDYSVGCAVSEVQAGIGGYGQTGEVIACKLKCSAQNMPDNYKMHYSNPRTGCSASVGYGIQDNPERETVITPQGVRVDVFTPTRPGVGLPVDVY